MPLYLKPPVDGIVALTDCWKAPLHLVKTNIYGLSNAPRLWSLTVIRRLKELGYHQHSFDRMVFLKFEDGGTSLLSIIIVYVDDFLGTYREDYDISEVHNAFKWGSLQDFQVGVAITFKGKQLTLRQRAMAASSCRCARRSSSRVWSAAKFPVAATSPRSSLPARGPSSAAFQDASNG